MIYITPKSDTIRHGSSLAAFDELMHKFKYVLVETTTYNAFFVPLELYERSKTLQAFVPDTSIEVLNEISMGTSLYQLYDGTLKLAGCKKLLWHRIPIDEDKIRCWTSSRFSVQTLGKWSVMCFCVRSVLPLECFRNNSHTRTHRYGTLRRFEVEVVISCHERQLV